MGIDEEGELSRCDLHRHDPIDRPPCPQHAAQQAPGQQQQTGRAPSWVGGWPNRAPDRQQTPHDPGGGPGDQRRVRVRHQAGLQPAQQLHHQRQGRGDPTGKHPAAGHAAPAQPHHEAERCEQPGGPQHVPEGGERGVSPEPVRSGGIERLQGLDRGPPSRRQYPGGQDENDPIDRSQPSQPQPPCEDPRLHAYLADHGHEVPASAFSPPLETGWRPGAALGGPTGR